MVKSTKTPLLPIQHQPSSSQMNSPSLSPPPSFNYSPENSSSPLNLIDDSLNDPLSYSPPKSFTTSAPQMVDSFDKFFKQKKTISLEPRKSVRIASQPHRVSYINLETPEPCMQRQSSLYLSKNSSITLAS